MLQKDQSYVSQNLIDNAVDGEQEANSDYGNDSLQNFDSNLLIFSYDYFLIWLVFIADTHSEVR